MLTVVCAGLAATLTLAKPFHSSGEGEAPAEPRGSRDDGKGAAGASLSRTASNPENESAPPAAAFDGDKDDKATKQELARLQGVWTMLELEANGRQAQPGEMKWILVIEGNQYNPGLGELSLEYTFRIDPSLTPKAIDLIPQDGPERGKTIRGIYALEGDTLKICRPLDSYGDRPAGFTTRPGSNTSRVVWKKRKA
jgi:uncharacterized protein (TIGR03067 family)